MTNDTTEVKNVQGGADLTQSVSLWQKQESIAEIKKIYGQGLTDGEFSTLVQIGLATRLNPFLREIWAVKYDKRPASIFIGRDGYRKAAQSNAQYDYHLVDAVYSNDQFNVDNGEVKHTYSVKDRGTLVGAYCVVKRKEATKPMFNFVELKEYNLNQSLWTTKPATMIKKVAEAQGLRMTFQELFAGTYDESEKWEEVDTTKIPFESEVAPEPRYVPIDSINPTVQPIGNAEPIPVGKTCQTCGRNFKPKFDWATDCIDCYYNKKNAVLSGQLKPIAKKVDPNEPPFIN